MPFYEYQCRACGEQTEVLQKISDAPLRKCPACGKNQLEKLVSAPVFRLKGGGWYETDFKSDAEKKRNLAGAEKDAGGDKGGEAPGGEKAGDKPEKKAEPAAAESKPAAAKTVSKPATAKPAAKKPARASSAKKTAGRR